MISYCGMDCEKCEGYLATAENDDRQREIVAQNWTKQYNSDIKPEHINCTGCKSNGIKFFFTENGCPLRKCNIEKSTDNCAACADYKCETLRDFIEQAPPIGDALEKLRKV